MDRKEQLIQQIRMVKDEIKSLNLEKNRLETKLKEILDREDYVTEALTKEETLSHIVNLFNNHKKPKLFCIHGLKFYCNAGNVEFDEDKILLKMRWNGIVQPTVILHDTRFKITVKHFDRYILCVPDKAQITTHEGSQFINDIQ